MPEREGFNPEEFSASSEAAENQSPEEETAAEEENIKKRKFYHLTLEEFDALPKNSNVVSYSPLEKGPRAFGGKANKQENLSRDDRGGMVAWGIFEENLPPGFEISEENSFEVQTTTEKFYNLTPEQFDNLPDEIHLSKLTLGKPEGPPILKGQINLENRGRVTPWAISEKDIPEGFEVNEEYSREIEWSHSKIEKEDNQE